MTKKIIKTALISSSIIAYSALTPVAALSSGNGGQACEGAQIRSYESGNETQMTYTDSNNIIDSVCIKSGSKMFSGNQHSSPLGNGTYENGCYEVSGVGTNSVSVKRLKDGPSCQSLSHLDIFTKQSSTTQDSTEETIEETKIETKIVEKVIEKIVEKRVEVIKEVEVVKEVNKPVEQVLSTEVTQLANTGLSFSLMTKLLISSALFTFGLFLTKSYKKYLI